MVQTLREIGKIINLIFMTTNYTKTVLGLIQ